MVYPSERYIEAFKYAKNVIYFMVEKNETYSKNKDPMFELLVTYLLYINEKGYDFNEIDAVYEIFKGTNLSVLKYKFGVLPKNSEAAASFFGFRSRLPDAEINEANDRLEKLLYDYIHIPAIKQKKEEK